VLKYSLPSGDISEVESNECIVSGESLIVSQPQTGLIVVGYRGLAIVNITAITRDDATILCVRTIDPWVFVATIKWDFQHNIPYKVFADLYTIQNHVADSEFAINARHMVESIKTILSSEKDDKIVEVLMSVLPDEPEIVVDTITTITERA